RESDRVVALHEQARAAPERSTEAGQLFDRRRFGRERHRWQAGERAEHAGSISRMTTLLERLRAGGQLVGAELGPPRAELAATASMDAWIDTYHAVRRLTQHGTYVFLTDGAVGSKEEDNLRHLVTNLGGDVPRSSVVPFLTCKHPLDYCLAYADRAHQHGFEALVVLGGDKSVGPARCVEHAWQLREEIRARVPALTLGGWANPHADARAQVGHLLEDRAHAEFYLTQIVSHHS